LGFDDALKGGLIRFQQVQVGSSLSSLSLRTASQRSSSSSQAVAMVSSSAAGFLGALIHGRAKDTGLTPRWREPGARTFSMKAAEIRPSVVVMWGGVAIQSSSPSLRRISSK